MKLITKYIYNREDSNADKYANTYKYYHNLCINCKNPVYHEDICVNINAKQLSWNENSKLAM